MLDLIIRGGHVIDGSGTPRRAADVGVQGGRIVAIGPIDVDATRVIEAAGRIVAPGFIDVHTHFDAQVFWDGALTPSPFHGVTTVLAGNCGFSIAPLSESASDREYLKRMLSRVEGMPLESLDEGVPWDWRSTGDYLAAVEPLLGINAGFMVGHSAIRRQVMGREAVERVATAIEVGSMADKLREGLEAGGIGFSSSWARTHSDAEGQMVPSRHATKEELLALCTVAGEFDGTSLEFIPMVGRFGAWARELMADMSVVAGRTLNWNVLTINNLTAEDIDNRLQAGNVAQARGGRVIALTMPLSVGPRLNFASGFVLDAIPGWEPFMHSSRSDRLAGLADPESRAALGAAALSEKNPLRVPVNWDAHVIFDVVAPENAQYLGLKLGDIAADQERPAWDVLCDIVVTDELGTSFGTPTADLSRDEWQRRIDVARDERTVIGASDAGAHVDLFGTFKLSNGPVGRSSAPP